MAGAASTHTLVAAADAVDEELHELVSGTLDRSDKQALEMHSTRDASGRGLSGLNLPVLNASSSHLWRVASADSQ
jgi:hypothetical protein